MHYADQAALPGGSIGPKETNSQGTRWLAPGAGDESEDRTLERTSLRYGPGGWYVVTAAAKRRRGERTERAICRCGPFADWRDAERALMRSTRAPETNLGIELSDAQSAVMGEGLKKRLLDAGDRWSRRSGTIAETRALAGLHVPPGWRRQPQLLEAETPEGKKFDELYREVLAAFKALEQWRNA